jgi:hypothetical protein
MLALRALESAPDGMVVTIGEPTRSLEQNALQWPILNEIARDFRWVVNGQFTHMSAEEWKNLLTSAFRKETAQVAQGWDGGICLIGHRTRDFGKKEFSAWIDFLQAAHEQLKIQQPKETAA